MTTHNGSSTRSASAALANYCVCFIDLLGQKAAMAGQGLLPEHETPEQYEALIKLAKSTVGQIVGVHKHAATMLASMNQQRDPPGPLGDAEREAWRQFHIDNTVTQRWSDGLMVFASLADAGQRPVIHDVYTEFCLAGAMCLIGLAGKAPLRGGLDIAWGIELNPGELYGPAVANAYILESTCAKFPRIVVGEHVARFLETIASSTASDLVSRVSRVYAEKCLGMLSRDKDGLLFVDYLGQAFEGAVTSEAIEGLWTHARSFVDAQLTLHAEHGAKELVHRYSALAEYFDAHPPPSKRTG
jgi:hypothetical protein